ncbi:MAG: hypothetical protein DRR08_13060 [Candidatus Parabeggiatoa sp. nov. 2]|nr:MAG: hypothetical protein DRR08_13060 [Gammaproteobacteria bacterium]
MKAIRFTRHALEQCVERGTNQVEVRKAIREGSQEPAKYGRVLCRANFQYNDYWQGRFYQIKQVAPVIKEEDTEMVVITVYTFYF